jgi:hypothetical protein
MPCRGPSRSTCPTTGTLRARATPFCGAPLTPPLRSRPRYDLFEYQGEDVSLGIWLDESPFDVKFVTSNRFWYDAKCENAEVYSIGHQLTPERMRECFEMMDEKPAV